MRWREQLKEDRKKLREMESGRQRRIFIWDYYKAPILAAAFVLLFLFAVLLGSAGRKDVCLHAVLVNSDSPAGGYDDTVFDRLLAEAGADTGRKKAEINAELFLGKGSDESDDLDALQVLNAKFLLSEIDLYVSDAKYFAYFAEAEAFADLSLLIDRDLLAGVPEEDRYYAEDQNGNRTLKGIWLREGSALHRAGYYHGGVLVGAVSGGENLDNAVAAIAQLLRDRN